MKIQLIITFVILFPLLSFAQNSNTASKRIYYPAANVAANATVQPTPEPQKVKLKGRLIYEDTGRPVRRGKISLLKIQENTYSGTNETYQTFQSSYGIESITNDDGEFEIDKVLPGEYFPKIDVLGVLNPNTFSDLYKKGYSIDKEKLSQLFEKIVVIEGVSEQQILVRAKRGGAISGKVDYFDGDSANGVRVELLRNSKEGFEISATAAIGQTNTDDRGFYRFVGLPEGEYIVRIFEPTVQNIFSYRQSNSSELKTYYGDTNIVKDAKRIQISGSIEESEINITISDQKKYTISGSIIAKSNKKPIINTQINLEKEDDEDGLLKYSATSTIETSTDEKGNWKIVDLPKGKYTLEFSVIKNYEEDFEDKGDAKKTKPKKPIIYAKIEKEIEIKDEDLTNLVIEMPIASQVSGTIMFEDKREVNNLTVSLFDEEKDFFSYTALNSNDDEDDENE
ncbi:MAG: hypothetical protein MUC29_09405, partial [Pyrinomonadaceae bacterium]|nr:hypothetical protein [Pyrinomonadaceae bacterium]